MVARAIDYQASSVTLRTRAKGMLSRLAHDLEIEATRFDADLDLDAEKWRATLRFDVRGLRVVGALKGDRVDRGALKASDREDIERRIVDEHLTGETITVVAEGQTRERGDVTVRAPKGEQRLSVPIAVEERSDGQLVAYGDLKLSLRRLGVSEIKGPLGAFKVDDTIAVAFHLVIDAAA